MSLTQVKVLQGGTGASVRAIDNKFKDSVHVEDFGAVGNGTTNDATAFQNAINHVAGLGGGPMGEPGVDPKKKKKKKQTLIDGRTKAYRQHREKLEKAGLKRLEAQKKRGKFVESIVSDMSEMSYGAGSHGAIRPQADLSNVQSSKSPLQRLKDFDKSRTASGKTAIFTDKVVNNSTE